MGQLGTVNNMKLIKHVHDCPVSHCPLNAAGTGFSTFQPDAGRNDPAVEEAADEVAIEIIGDYMTGESWIIISKRLDKFSSCHNSILGGVDNLFRTFSNGNPLIDH